jgi:hypothetical protein
VLASSPITRLMKGHIPKRKGDLSIALSRPGTSQSLLTRMN